MNKIDIALIGLVITALLGLASLIVSIFSLKIGEANRRNNQLNRIHAKQFEFFLGVQDFISKIDSLLTDNFNSNPSLAKELEVVIDDFYKYINKHEFLIPDDIYFALNDYYNYCSGIDDSITENMINLTKELRSDFADKTDDFEDDIRSHFKIEELSEENKRLSKKTYN